MHLHVNISIANAVEIPTSYNKASIKYHSPMHDSERMIVMITEKYDPQRQFHYQHVVNIAYNIFIIAVVSTVTLNSNHKH